MLHILLLIACICIALATVLYLFYWNRFIAWIIGLVIRVLYWNQGASSIWLEIGASFDDACREALVLTRLLGSIHFSILTGRILLKDIRYHSSNQTAKIVKGQIEWRYWIRRPMTEDELRVPLLEGGMRLALVTMNLPLRYSLHRETIDAPNTMSDTNHIPRLRMVPLQ